MTDPFTDRLADLGFDDDQRQIVEALMQDAYLGGIAWAYVREHGETGGTMLGVAVMVANRGRPKMSPADLDFALSMVMESRAQPMSPEVAQHAGGGR